MSVNEDLLCAFEILQPEYSSDYLRAAARNRRSMAGMSMSPPVPSVLSASPE